MIINKLHRIPQWLLLLLVSIQFDFQEIKAQKLEDDSLRIVNTFNSVIGKPGEIDSVCKSLLNSIADNPNTSKLKEIYWFNLSKTYFYTGLLDQSFLAAESGLASFNKEKPEYGAAKFYNMKASVYSYRKDNEQAILNFQQALKIVEENADKHTAALIKNNIANIFFTINNYEGAYKYSNESLKQLKFENDSVNLPGVEAIVAISAIKTGKSQEGKKHALEALNLAGKYNNPLGKIIGNYSLGEYYSYEQKYDSAIVHFNNSLELSNLLHQGHFAMLNKIGLQVAYLKLIDYKNSVKYGLEALEESRKLQNENTLYAIYKNLGYAYAGQSDFKKAYTNMQLAHETYIDFAGMENQKAINDILIKYDTEKKEKQLIVSKNELIEKENKLFKRNQWIIILSFTLIVLLFIYLYYRRVQDQKLRQIRQEEKARLLQVSIDAEESERERISNELHDGLASSITAVRLRLENISKKNQISEIEPILRELSEIHDETRRVSHNLMPAGLNENNWVDRIKSYCIENSDKKLRIYFSDNLSKTISVEPQKSVILFRIVQELIHNVRKHAQSKICYVQIVEAENGISISVEDEGIGFNPEATKGQGLASIAGRMKHINGSLEIESRIGKGSLITLEIKLAS
ncbi:MAG: histidine kinase [Bacteroidia bacterium]